MPIPLPPEFERAAYTLTETDQALLHAYAPDVFAEPVFHDTAQLLDADPNERLQTAFMRRTDGIYGIYPGCHVAIYGEPGSGKTMLAKFATMQALNEGKKVAHVDIDDNRREVIAHDILKMGTTRLNMLDSWKLSQPDTIERLEALWERLTTDSYDLVIIDSMASLEGLTSADANQGLDFVQRIYLPYVKRLMNAGVAVISIDHTGKDRDRRGALGSIQKLAKSDLAINVVAPDGGGLVPGQLGAVALYIDKDRYGQVKADAQLREYKPGHTRYFWGTFTIPVSGLKDSTISPPIKSAPNKIEYNF